MAPSDNLPHATFVDVCVLLNSFVIVFNILSNCASRKYNANDKSCLKIAAAFKWFDNFNFVSHSVDHVNDSTQSHTPPQRSSHCFAKTW
jgi:hypothetical protein